MTSVLKVLKLVRKAQHRRDARLWQEWRSQIENDDLIYVEQVRFYDPHAGSRIFGLVVNSGLRLPLFVKNQRIKAGDFLKSDLRSINSNPQIGEQEHREDFWCIDADIIKVSPACYAGWKRHEQRLSRTLAKFDTPAPEPRAEAIKFTQMVEF